MSYFYLFHLCTLELTNHDFKLKTEHTHTNTHKHTGERDKFTLPPYTPQRILTPNVIDVNLNCCNFKLMCIFLNIFVCFFLGMGFGLIYLPAIVCVSMYFEKKRAFATGIAVCGSGIGTFIMAPVSQG